MNGRNLIQGINTWTKSLIRYAGEIMNWGKKDLKDQDITAREMLAINIDH